MSNERRQFTSSYVGSGWTDTNAGSIKNSAFIFGAHNATGKTVTFNGDIDIQETARFGFQYGGSAVLNGALTGSGNIGLNHQTGDASTLTLSGSTSGYTGAITVGNNVTLKFGAVTSATGFGGTITTTAGSRGVVVTPALGNSTSGQRIHDVVKAMNTKVDTADGTFITLTAGSNDDDRELRLGSSDNTGNNADITLNQNFKFTNLLIVHGGGNSKQLLVNSGATLQFDGGVHVVSKSNLNIDGGNLVTTGITLGHSTNTNGSHWGKLVMGSGSVKTGTITFRNQSDSAVQITGGLLEFTSATAITKTGSPSNTSVNIMGEDSTDAKRVILKATSTDWTLNGSSVDTATVGNVTIDASNTHGITFDNVTLSGSIVNNHKLSLLDGVSFASNAETVLSGTGTTYFANTIATDSSVTVGGTLALSSDIGIFESNGGSVSYVLDASNIDATNELQNGFQCTSGDGFWLLKGANSNLADGVTSITSADGTTTYTLQDVDGGILISSGGAAVVNPSKYYISANNVDVVGTGGTGTPTGAESYVIQGGTMNLTSGTIKSSEIDYTSGGINLASSSSTLSIDSPAENLITLATGSGNIEINNTSTLGAGDSTLITGDIVVNAGGNLRLGTHFDDYESTESGVTVNIAGGIKLKGGTLSLSVDTTTLKSVTTEGNATSRIYIRDMSGSSGSNDASGVLTINELVVNSGMQIQSVWKSNLNIAALSGSGELQLQQRVSGNNQVVTINAGTGYTGQLNLDGGSSMTLNLNIAEGAKTRIKGDNDSTIATLNLANGATLALDTQGGTINNVQNAAYNYTLTNVNVANEATISTADSGGGWQAQINIGTLSNKEGSSSGILKLTSKTNTTQRAIVNLNGGTFNGEIALTGSNTNSDRKIALNITNKEAAKNALITLNGNGSQVALGIGNSEVIVKGIRNAANATGDIRIVSGSQAYLTNEQFSSDSTTRTLEIATQGGSYTTSAVLGANLNLKKSGTGTQTFSGSMANFTGNITVTAGELVFNNAVSTGEIAVSGGTLTVGTYDGTGSIASESTLTVTSSATFGAGAKVNANLVLNNAINVKMDAALTMGSTLTLGERMVMSGNMYDKIINLGAGQTINLFTGVDELTLGNQTYSSTSLPEAGKVTLSTYFSNITKPEIYLGYNGSDVFAGVLPIPEPTTATLSLLALAGLAARRRRK